MLRQLAVLILDLAGDEPACLRGVIRLLNHLHTVQELLASALSAYLRSWTIRFAFEVATLICAKQLQDHTNQCLALLITCTQGTP